MRNSIQKKISKGGGMDFQKVNLAQTMQHTTKQEETDYEK
jgi:hypothetical protein